MAEPLINLITDRQLDILLSPKVVLWWSGLEYDRLEALKDVAERKTGKVLLLEERLEDVFIKSL